MKIKTYSELIQLPTFQERLDYLRLDGQVGLDTFGFDRYLNQKLYQSREWSQARDRVVVRDNGFDLGIEEYPIFGSIYVHHLNPLTPEDIEESSVYLFDQEYLISSSFDTHNAIHYGTESGGKLYSDYVERKANDTCPWR